MTLFNRQQLTHTSNSSPMAVLGEQKDVDGLRTALVAGLSDGPEADDWSDRDMWTVKEIMQKNAAWYDGDVAIGSAGRVW